MKIEKEHLELILNNIGWPLCIIIIVLIFKKQIRRILLRISEFSILGAKVKLQNLPLKFAIEANSKNPDFRKLVLELEELISEVNDSKLLDNPFKISTINWRIAKLKEYVAGISNERIWRIGALNKYGYTRYIFDGALQAFEGLKKSDSKIDYVTISSAGFWINDWDEEMSTESYTVSNILSAKRGASISRVIIIPLDKYNSDPSKFKNLWNLFEKHISRLEIEDNTNFSLHYHFCEDYSELAKTGKLHLGGIASVNDEYYMLIEPQIGAREKPVIEVKFVLKNHNGYDRAIEMINQYSELIVDKENTIKHSDINKSKFRIDN